MNTSFFNSQQRPQMQKAPFLWGKNNNNLDFMLLIVSEEESAGFRVLIPPQIKTICIFAKGFLNSKIHLL